MDKSASVSAILPALRLLATCKIGYGTGCVRIRYVRFFLHTAQRETDCKISDSIKGGRAKNGNCNRLSGCLRHLCGCGFGHQPYCHPKRLHQRCTGRDSATKATGRSGNWLCRKRSGSCHSRCQERSRTAKEKRITGSQR